MRKQLSVMAGLVGAAMLTAGAHAGGVTLTADVSTAGDNSYAFGNYAATGLQTALISVSGLDPAWSLLSVNGQTGNAMSITTSDGSSFFNALELGQTHFAPSAALYAAFPELQWDTWVQVDPGNTSVAPGFPNVALAGGGGNFSGNENVAWFDGDPGTAVTGSSSYVIGQFSWDATQSMTITVNVQVDTGPLSGTAEFFGLTITIPAVPAPGAMALLGLAGVCGVSRRRRKA